ncbi:MAG: hypothetical protein JWM90_774 [Thermoleophilia bacterium]|nr:hypothetical protein [Thermoleophilia bacterium]
MRRTRHLLLVTMLALFAAGCGGSDAPKEDAPRKPAQPGVATTTDARSSGTARGCTPPAIPRAVGPVTNAARRTLSAATRRATATAHQFHTRATITTQRGLTARAQVTGAVAPTGTSTARLRWEGAAALLLPDLALRIRDNRLAVGISGAAPVDRGSASGIALDVGRELHTHPFLLDLGAATTTPARTTPARTVIAATARPAELRAYAGTERQGLATELLVGARRLTITTVIDDGRMTADTFTLVTQVPARFQRQLGRGTVTVRATTAYCFTP